MKLNRLIESIGGMDRQRQVILAAALVVAVGAACLQWDNKQDEDSEAGMNQVWNDRWQGYANQEKEAKEKERQLVQQGGFITPEQVKWKLVYEQGQQRNYLEVKVINPLRYHRVNVGLNFSGRTQEWAAGGRHADSQVVAAQVWVKDIGAGEVGTAKLRLPTTVETRATSILGQARDTIRWDGLPTAEALMDPASIVVRVFGEEGRMSEDESVPAHETLAKNQSL